MKIHYIGYTSIYDEWRDIDEIEDLDACEKDSDAVSPTPYSLYKDLSIKIKQALSCNRKGSPIVQIDMPFDLIQFNGGLKEYGFLFRTYRGVKRYRIKH